MGKLVMTSVIPWARKYKLHYAWVILVAAALIKSVSQADMTGFGVYVDPLVQLHGWSRGSISLAYSLAFIAGLPSVLIVGQLAERFGARWLVLGGVSSITAGMLLMPRVTELWHFYLFYSLLMGGLGMAVFNVVLPVTITRWFHRRVGLATGLYWGAVGAGPMLLVPVFRWLIDNQGWERAFYILGIGIGSVLFLASRFVWGRPEEKGMVPYGAEERKETRPAPPPPVPLSVNLRNALAQPSVWSLMAIHHLGCVGHAIILAHVVSMATLQGIPGVTAAGILSVIAGGSIFSRFIYSVLTERLGGRVVLTLAILGQVLPVLPLLWAREPWAFYLFGLAFGLGYGGEMVGFPIINRQLYGERAPLNTIYSFEMLGASVGMAIGGWLGGMLFDLSGSYTWSILASAAASGLALPFCLSLPRHRRQVAPIAATAPSGQPP